MVAYSSVVKVLATYTASASGPVTVDGPVSTVQLQDPPWSWSHTVGSGANRLLVVAIATSDKGKTPSGVTFGAASLTAAQTTSIKKAASSLWYLVNPAISTDTITVTYLNDPPGSVGGAVTFVNVDQTTPVSGAIGLTGDTTSPSVNVISATDDMVISVLGVMENPATATGTPTPTVHWSILEVGGKAFGIGTTQAGQTSVTSSFSVSGGGGFDWALSAVNIKKAP